jgi:hypothetical protein
MATSSKRAVATVPAASNDSTAPGKNKAAGFSNSGSGAARLAEFFPGALAMHVPATVERDSVEDESQIQALIEFGTAKEVIVTCSVPLEIGESLRISSPNCSLKATAKVVALQVGAENYALAVRFTAGAENWIIQE